MSKWHFDEESKVFLREELAELLAEYQTIAEMTSIREQVLELGHFFQKLLVAYATPDGKVRGLIPLIRLQEKTLGLNSDGRVYRAARTHQRIQNGGSVSESKLRQAGTDFLRAARTQLRRIGELCDANVEFKAKEKKAWPGGTETSNSEQQPDAGLNATIPSRFDIPYQLAISPDEIATEVVRLKSDIRDVTASGVRISASAVSEYSFCPRAGVLTHESTVSARDEVPAYGLLPWFERDAILAAYFDCTMKLYGYMTGFIAGLFILRLVSMPTWLSVSLLSTWAGAGMYLTVRCFQDWITLRKRRFAANWASPCIPAPNATGPQAVTWWGLLAAGFEVRTPDEPFTDRKWNLIGKPHRILKRGDLEIPVHRAKNSDGVLRHQHIIRGMVHCHLLDVNLGSTCPYAVILFGDSYDGVTVPSTRENREKFYEMLERTRAMIQETDAGERVPPEPIDASQRCSGCFFAHPRPAEYREETTKHGKSVDPYFFSNGNGRLFHCSCGDRFQWVPKHKGNTKMRRRN